MLGPELPVLLSVLLTALTLGPAMAHLLEAPVKLFLPREQYFQVQQIYRGWAFAGVFVVGALLSTTWLAMNVQGQAFWLTLVEIERTTQEHSETPHFRAGDGD